jgi:integrase
MVLGALFASWTVVGRLTRAQQCWAHLERLLGAKTRALDVTPQRLDAYAAPRMGEGASRQTANTELAVLRQGYKLAIEKGLLAAMPIFKLSKVRNARSGFFEPGDFAALLLELPAHAAADPLRALAGWRISEILTLTWDAVDWDGQVIRLAPSQTKGWDARIFPFGGAPELREPLEGQCFKRHGLFLFHRHGQRIKTFCRARRSACKRAGLEGRLVHDCAGRRRGTARRAGVSEGEIMKLCGRKTRAMSTATTSSRSRTSPLRPEAIHRRPRRRAIA